MNELIFCRIGSALETDFNSNCAYFCDKNEIVDIDPSLLYSITFCNK